jgi:hypothetical protein
MDTPPYDKMVEKRDRSWSLRLLERLLTADIPEEERSTIAYTLTELDDPRIMPRLLGIMVDSTHPNELREVASSILLPWGYVTDDATLDRWWSSDDLILQRHALRRMGIEHTAIVESVAADPKHPFYKDVIDLMYSDFELPRHQQVVIQALAHEDAEVRKAAASSLLWNEPIAAEDALLRATYDPVPEVVEEACNTLQYYYTQRVFRRMSELLTHENETVRTEAEKTYQDLRYTFLFDAQFMDKRVRKHIHRWLAPIWDELAYTKQELKGKKSRKSRPYSPNRQPITTRRVLELLTDPDTSVVKIQRLFWDSDWRSIPKEDHKLLTRTMLGHADHTVRAESSRMFSQWGDQKSLVMLLDDEQFYPRKCAMFHLGKTPPFRDKIANIVWDYFERERPVPVHGSETLETYVAHAKPKHARPHLIELAFDEEQPEGIRDTAVWKLDTRKTVLAVMPLIERDPVLTWSLHVALLDQAEKFKITPPSLERLREVDHLSIQQAIAPFL